MMIGARRNTDTARRVTSPGPVRSLFVDLKQPLRASSADRTSFAPPNPHPGAHSDALVPDTCVSPSPQSPPVGAMMLTYDIRPRARAEATTTVYLIAFVVSGLIALSMALSEALDRQVRGRFCL